MKSSINALKMRKGAWSHDEDTLLRKCVEEHGDGKWHLVPQRAGLNRCRKSCRLRWLNYLRPEINRGNFGADEVDLMTRLHKLVGNRWSLIAGRLPGRTANDIKNYWTTNVRKKLTTAISFQKEVTEKQICTNITDTNVVIKPIPRTLSKGTTVPCYNLNPTSHISSHSTDENNNNNNNNGLINMPSSPAALPPDESGMEWWKNLFAKTGMHGEQETSPEGLMMAPTSGSEDMDAERGLISTPLESAVGLMEDGDWNDIWDFLNSESND